MPVQVFSEFQLSLWVVDLRGSRWLYHEVHSTLYIVTCHGVLFRVHMSLLHGLSQRANAHHRVLCEQLSCGTAGDLNHPRGAGCLKSSCTAPYLKAQVQHGGRWGSGGRSRQWCLIKLENLKVKGALYMVYNSCTSSAIYNSCTTRPQDVRSSESARKDVHNGVACGSSLGCALHAAATEGTPQTGSWAHGPQPTDARQPCAPTRKRLCKLPSF